MALGTQTGSGRLGVMSELCDALESGPRITKARIDLCEVIAECGSALAAELAWRLNFASQLMEAICRHPVAPEEGQLWSDCARAVRISGGLGRNVSQLLATNSLTPTWWQPEGPLHRRFCDAVDGGGAGSVTSYSKQSGNFLRHSACSSRTR